MNIGELALSAIAAAFPSNVVQIRYAGIDTALVATIGNAFCSGLEEARGHTEQGLINDVQGNVRYLSSVEPDAWKDGINGQLVEVLFYGESEWQQFRVMGRKSNQGAVRLNLIADYEEAR